MLICFIGMDGTGKTRHATYLYKRLREKGLNCIYIHPYFEYSCTLKKLLSLSLFSESAKKKRGELVIQAQKRKKLHGVERSESIILRLWTMLVFIDNLVTYIVSLRGKAKKSIVISDRYYYDQIMVFYSHGIICRYIANFYLKILPRPDIIFLFDAPVEVAYERSGEYSPLFYKKLRRAYLNLSEKLTPKPTIIDTTKDFSEASTEVFKEIMRLRGEAENYGAVR